MEKYDTDDSEAGDTEETFFVVPCMAYQLGYSKHSL